MEFRIILVNLAGRGSDDATVLDAAGRIAAKGGIHLSVTCRHQPGPVLLGAPGTLASAAQEQAAFEHFTRWQITARLPSDSTAGWLVPTNEVDLIHVARLADLALVAHPHAWPDPGRHDLTALIYDSGRPVLLVPAEGPTEIDRHVMVAWNGSREAARAVTYGLPLLQAAARVSIFSHIDDSAIREGRGPRELLDHLAWHGIDATLVTGKDGEERLATELLEHCRTLDAGLLVAGAYASSPLHERITGGMTHHLLSQAKLPLLMMH